MKTQATTGIILRRIDYGEADRIIAFLTKDAGKIRVMAKGVRKQKSKLAGGIELFSLSEVHFIKGRGDMGTLTSTRLIRHYGNIVKDLKRTEFAYVMLRHIDKTVEDGTGQDYFEVLDESFQSLDAGISLDIIELSFWMRILYLQGMAPDFSVDSNGEKLNPEGSFNFDSNKLSFIEKAGGKFNKNHLKVLKLLSHNSPRSLMAVENLSSYCTELKPIIVSLQYSSL